MIKILFFLLITTSLLGVISCKNQKNNEEENQKVVGDIWMGGTFKFQSHERITSLFPLSSIDAYTRNISFQIFEPLLKTDLSSMRTIPNVAKSYSVNEECTIYTLELRKNIKFHSDPCFPDETRDVTIEDFKYSLELACSGLSINKMAYLFQSRIKGAQSFNRRTRKTIGKNSVSGIKIISDTTITIELTKPFAGFEQILAHPNLCIMAKEAVAYYGKDIDKHPVGTGPFVLAEMSYERILLEKNPSYWRFDKLGNRLPYIDWVELTYSTSKAQELEAFRTEKSDIMMDIPIDQINDILGTLQAAQKGENIIHKVKSEPSMSMMYIGFACESKEFKDVRVRQAFNIAVDRNELINSHLGGEGWPAANGFIPPLDFYPNEDVIPMCYNVEKAKELLADAGFPDGKGFPDIEVYVNAQVNSPNFKMVEGVIDQIEKNLGVCLRIKQCTLKERDIAIATGKAKMWRAGWIADYAHPENFLSLFYSRNINRNNNTINSFKFNNAEFDDIFSQAMVEQDETVRNQLFVLCDQKVVDQAVVMPILTEDFIVLINSKIKNFQPNSMEILDFSTLFIKSSRR
ncbi:MAG: oligopeptide transport system substrate-binding protein [Psychromonas sp.]|jgi:oligopeptide transport system substrate-binding protein